ncbi:MAG: hypothetical protein ACI8TQ_002585, partial [Planctomycetota bacterium]
EFRADTFLINAVADLVLPPNLASIAGRRQVARGLDYMDGDEKARWRGFVIAVGPIALLAFGLLRLVWRGRKSAFASVSAKGVN